MEQFFLRRAAAAGASSIATDSSVWTMESRPSRRSASTSGVGRILGWRWRKALRIAASSPTRMIESAVCAAASAPPQTIS